MQQSDLELREHLLRSGQLSEGYHPDMEALHLRNAYQLEVIIDQIGFPTIDTVGAEGAAAAWLLLQHAISRPAFQRRCATLLEKAVQEQRADAMHLAYLRDRIAVFEGQPQHYGTQFDWDETGQLAPQPCEDPHLVDQRRLALGLNTLEEQTEDMRRRAREEGQQPPANPGQRKKDFDAWRRRVGWL